MKCTDNKPHILLVNDDGIESEGLALLARQAAAFGHVWVAAPAEQCSAMSQRISIFNDLEIDRADFPEPVMGAWRVRGTPADCVKAALNRLLPLRPDFVFSGINNGWNTGFDIAYSGTVGAAMEALMQGVPAFAFSNAYQGSFAVLERELPGLMGKVLALPREQNAIWNVNFPGCEWDGYRGVLWDRRVAPTQLYLDRFTCEEGEDGSLRMRNRGVPLQPELAQEGTDVHAVLHGFTSVGKIQSMVL